jgi:hypothetical protein
MITRDIQDLIVTFSTLFHASFKMEIKILTDIKVKISEES